MLIVLLFRTARYRIQELQHSCENTTARLCIHFGKAIAASWQHLLVGIFAVNKKSFLLIMQCHKRVSSFCQVWARNPAWCHWLLSTDISTLGARERKRHCRWRGSLVLRRNSKLIIFSRCYSKAPVNTMAIGLLYIAEALSWAFGGVMLNALCSEIKQTPTRCRCDVTGNPEQKDRMRKKIPSTMASFQWRCRGIFCPRNLLNISRNSVSK